MGRLYSRRSIDLLLIVLSFPAFPCQAQETGDAASPEKQLASEDTDTLMARFQDASERERRSEVFEVLMARGAEVVGKLKTLIEKKVADDEREYAALLNARLRDAYLERLLSLTDEQIEKIQGTRRLWEHYLLETTDEKDFQERFLKPCWEVAGILLLKVENLQDERIAARRSELLEFGDYLTRCLRAKGVDPDPTKGRKSPTGIDYPPLDSPPTFRSCLSYLERTLVLADTVAPEGARKVLLGNAEVAREIDIEESEFVMFGNEVRMLMGTIAWSVDPVVCACTRDHSNDRKEGKASGHSSTIPGKESFVDRLKRFGTHGSSEGAGGGRDGRGYINGLSYGGGHTGPLYSLKRNVVGVGRRGGVYTSVYRTDESLKHPCPVTESELFMPPGLSRKDVAGSAAAPVLVCMVGGQYGAAHEQITRLLARSESPEKRSTASLALGVSRPAVSVAAREKVLFRFFAAWIGAEQNRRFDELAAIERCGDVYELKRRAEQAEKDFRGVPGFAERIAALSERVKQKELAAELRAGQTFHRIANGNFAPDTVLQAMKLFPRQFKDSVYAQAAEFFLSDPKEKTPFSFFLEKDESLKRYGYPPKR